MTSTFSLIAHATGGRLALMHASRSEPSRCSGATATPTGWPARDLGRLCR